MCALLQDSQKAPSFNVGPEDEVIFTDLSDIYRLKESNFLSDNGDIDEGYQEHHILLQPKGGKGERLATGMRVMFGLRALFMVH